MISINYIRNTAPEDTIDLDLLKMAAQSLGVKSENEPWTPNYRTNILKLDKNEFVTVLVRCGGS